MDKTTIDTYNKSAKVYSEKFSGMSQVINIKKMFDAWGKPNPRVLDLGCGDGRDAVEICKSTNHYLGVDISEGLLQIARDRKIPNAKFELADISSFDFSSEVDIIFASASLLHLEKEEVRKIFIKAKNSLSDGGLFHISTKKGEYKGPVVVQDGNGERTFYFYQLEDLVELAKDFKILSTEGLIIGKTDWINVLFRKM